MENTRKLQAEYGNTCKLIPEITCKSNLRCSLSKNPLIELSSDAKQISHQIPGSSSVLFLPSSLLVFRPDDLAREIGLEIARSLRNCTKSTVKSVR